jgi:hypothetical protein
VQAARRRAESAAALLRELGAAPNKLRVTWQGTGDVPVDGVTGRRVEIEFVARAPEVLLAKPASTAPAARSAGAAEPAAAARTAQASATAAAPRP